MGDTNTREYVDKLYDRFINETYTDEFTYETLKDVNKIKSHLVRRTRLRQIVELIKVNSQTLINTIDNLHPTNSIVIMLNFTNSINLMSHRLNQRNLYHRIIIGKTNKTEKTEIIDLFQRDEMRIVILSIQGGIGISLHDINGNYPRISFLSLNDNIVDMQQILGRIFRVNGKTNVTQYFLIVPDSVEAEVFANFKRKQKNMNLILDGKI